MPAHTPAMIPRSLSRHRRWRLLLLVQTIPLSSCPHAPARRLAVEHSLERFDAPLHPPRALPQLAQRLLVVARQATCRAPLCDVVADDPHGRDDDDEENGGDEKEDP